LLISLRCGFLTAMDAITTSDMRRVSVHGIIEHDGVRPVAGVGGPWRWAWEIKTVNAKGLDIARVCPRRSKRLGGRSRAHRQGDGSRDLLRQSDSTAGHCAADRSHRHGAARCARGRA
jgi:hypothetical protein